MKKILFILILIFSELINIRASDKMLLTRKQWLEDLDFVVEKLQLNHSNLYYKISKAEFDSIVAVSRNEIIQSQSDIECYFALKKIVASIEDGHTQIIENVDNGIFSPVDLRFPLRVDKFTDGVFITIINKEHEQFLGSRVLSINKNPIEDVLSSIEKIISMDNRFGRTHFALNGITFAHILFGLKIIDNTDSIDLELINKNGEPDKLKLQSISDNSNIEFGWSNKLNIGPTTGEYISPSDILGENIPLHFKNQGNKMKFYWFEYLINEKAIYFQFNQIMNQQNNDETFAQFSTRMWDYIDQNDENIDKFIIDLRYNDGGNGLIILPFLNQIIKRDFINKKGNLFIISGKKTYSAASILIYELLVHTEAVLVGEPDACGADLFSNSKHVGNLPNSDFQLWISSLSFTSRWPGNNTEYFMPDFPTPFSGAEYFSGKDPSLDLIFYGDLRTVEEVTSQEGANAGFEHYKILLNKYKEIIWWEGLNNKTVEQNINRMGYELMNNNQYDAAREEFLLNTMLFPNSANVWDSFAEWFYNMKKFEQAIINYKKSYALDPENENANLMIEKIKKELEEEK